MVVADGEAEVAVASPPALDAIVVLLWVARVVVLSGVAVVVAVLVAVGLLAGSSVELVPLVDLYK